MPVILGIETSCDETAAAVVCDRECRSNVIASQIELHAAFGGVVPELAARQHLECINQVIDRAMKDAQAQWSEIEGIAVTAAPGLIGGLLIGVTAAKTLSLIYQKPLIGIHHLEGHIFSSFLSDPTLNPPFLCLLVSGGHSSLIAVRDYGNYEIIGKTRDDAAGEAFDKVARLLGLGYPGGPAIDRVSTTGNPHAYGLPQGRIEGSPYDFSFSGLKTAVLRLTEKLRLQNPVLPIADIAASFQETVAEALVTRTIGCALCHNLATIVVVGGVAANRSLRQKLLTQSTAKNLTVVFPDLQYCTDNAAMIACAGSLRLSRGNHSPIDLAARSRMSLQDAASLYAPSLGVY